MVQTLSTRGPQDAAGLPASSVQVPGRGLLPVQGSPQTANGGTQDESAPVCMHRSTVTVYNPGSVAKIANGNSGDLPVGAFDELSLDLNLTAVSGTSPTIQFFLDRKGADGNYYPIWQSSSLTTVGSPSTQISASIGSGCATNQTFGATTRLRWVIGGTTPSWTFSASIQGK